MDSWVKYWAQRIAFVGTCAVIVWSVALQVSPPMVVLRGLVVGLVLYGALRLMGGLVGQALLREAVANELRNAELAAERGEGPDEDDDEDDEGEEKMSPDEIAKELASEQLAEERAEKEKEKQEAA